MRAWKAAAVFVAILAALDLAGAQVAKRVLPNWFRDMPGSNPRAFSPIYHHGFRPYADTKQRFGPLRYPIRTNSLGLIDGTARRVDAEAKGCRVMFAGDSFTEGLGNAWEDTFVGRLAARWADHGVDVLNEAAVSYSPTVHYRKIRHLLEDHGLRVDAVLLFLDVGDIADEWEQYELDDAGNVTARARDWLMRHQRGNPTPWDRLWFVAQDNSMTIHLARDLARRLAGGDGALPNVPRPADPAPRPEPEPPLGRIEPPPILVGPEAAARHLPAVRRDYRARWTIDQDLYDKFGRFGLAKAAAMMDRLLILLRERGVSHSVFVYPWPEQILAGDRDSVQVRFWRQWAATRGAGFVDLFPSFLGAGEAKDVLDRFVIPLDFHWNAAGHALVADTVGRAYEPRRFCK
ncbi:MAG: SGNH/GDSL hydrolase family protein [Alphaproteobacteria bacterium]|nr:SGNH/GDSL hydrolase family protein [Alphaproteobacteria bacterium]